MVVKSSCAMETLWTETHLNIAWQTQFKCSLAHSANLIFGSYAESGSLVVASWWIFDLFLPSLQQFWNAFNKWVLTFSIWISCLCTVMCCVTLEFFWNMRDTSQQDTRARISWWDKNYGLSDSEWQNVIGQSACTEEINHSFNCHFCLTVQNHFLRVNSRSSKGPGRSYTSEGEKKKSPTLWASPHFCRTYSVRQWAEYSLSRRHVSYDSLSSHRPAFLGLWSPRWPRIGELRTQKLKSHLMRTQSLMVLPLKPGVGLYIAMHATLTARDSFLTYFYPSGPFTCIFSKTSPEFFLCWLWLTPGPAWTRRIK